MLNVHELERRWLRYRIRRYIPVAATILALVVFLPAAFLLWPDEASKTVPVLPPEQVATAPVSTPAIETSQPGVQTVATVSPQAAATPVQQNAPVAVPVQTEPVPSAAPRTNLTPSMGFMQSMEEAALPYYAEEESATPVMEERVPEPVATVRSESNMPTEPVEEITTETSRHPVQKTEHTVSITQKEADDLNDVIKRFKTNKSPVLSLFIARRYYEINDYQNAYNYALKTNELDSEIEESWLIFAKALVKLGQQEQAVKVLKSYISHSGSVIAKSLLENIQSGQFK